MGGGGGGGGGDAGAATAGAGAWVFVATLDAEEFDGCASEGAAAGAGCVAAGDVEDGEVEFEVAGAVCAGGCDACSGLEELLLHPMFQTMMAGST
jgi:hypothetical protein